MRHGIHPVSRPVVFRDRAAGFQMLTHSTLDARRTVQWEDGVTYPVVDVEISSASHPFYTGMLPEAFRPVRRHARPGRLLDPVRREEHPPGV
ncbi:type B 50S ribosomal protein L31, partial [Streptomyces flaveolus]|uniref:type B 50S ribosomal protein L31 n=1 Tax=Streptomyces flaveolus TaxID=67297 RepID=UPI003F4D6136